MDAPGTKEDVVGYTYNKNQCVPMTISSDFLTRYAPPGGMRGGSGEYIRKGRYAPSLTCPCSPASWGRRMMGSALTRWTFTGAGGGDSFCVLMTYSRVFGNSPDSLLISLGLLGVLLFWGVLGCSLGALWGVFGSSLGFTRASWGGTWVPLISLGVPWHPSSFSSSTFSSLR